MLALRSGVGRVTPRPQSSVCSFSRSIPLGRSLDCTNGVVVIHDPVFPDVAAVGRGSTFPFTAACGVAAAVSMLLLIVLLNRGERSERSELSMTRDSTENIALPGQPVVLAAR